MSTRERKSAWARRVPLLPALVFTIALTQLPFLVTIGISLMDWNANFPDRIGFTGFDNYIRVFTDHALRSAVITSIVLTVSVVVGSLLLGFAIALLLNQRFRGRAAVRTMMVAPFLLVPIAAALLWKHLILNPSYGLINGTLGWIASLFGGEGAQPSWVTEFPLLTIAIVLIWQWTPFMMLIILAGLQSQPTDVLEAARVDGAGRVRIFTAITLPHVRRYLELATLLGAIYIFQNFDAVFTLTAGSFGTANLPYTIYRTFFEAQNYGLASAMGVVTVVGTIVFVTLFLRSLTTLAEGGNR
ncbi:carbohydrate ABC transporter permease [Rhodococcus opacus]|uniref:carbohydrate ABC transporter permease n=1 Tax=Rhodococcus opacus TaxID=37919 RepID=UPI001CEDBCE6|nr:sugar ABC transporter permease [Rhodococcus opacus]